MSSIINYGISETLKSVFAQLKETPGLNGNKYHSKDVEQLSQDIVCRNYGSVCYELSFLCWAVVNRSQLSVANSSTTHPFSSSTTLSTSPLLNFFGLSRT
ncbi:hypothetical protein RS130_23125 [Paraglaciecola aquimarina]|uniref:Uncharacterized protein n=1 Tax=Paraglaciecola aquimarina TaxID=1235557 RepID=A0ABU3T2A0_9ALTE|nr:hypothetical protein [Paraglaciecola aquimarina]MDU0356399.1 hypothetical protein [Paraglaciecola aquimarina]